VSSRFLASADLRFDHLQKSPLLSLHSAKPDRGADDLQSTLLALATGVSKRRKSLVRQPLFMTLIPRSAMSSNEPKPSTKRNFFQKPAWVIEKQRQLAETERSQLFERSGDCHADIVAEKDRRKKQREERAEKARRADQDKKEREDEQKRQKAKELMARSLSEAFLDADSLPESSHPSKRQAVIIDLDDSDNEPVSTNRDGASQSENGNYSTISPSALCVSDNALPKNGELNVVATSFAVGDTDDFDDIQIKAYLQQEGRHDISTGDLQTESKNDGPDPPLQILIDTKIPNTKPLVVKRYYRDNMRIVRKTWCERQGFSTEQTKSVILTWRGKRVYDVANCKSLGIELNRRGEPVIKVGADGYDAEGDKIVFVATTHEILEQEIKAAEEAAKRKEEAYSDDEEQQAKEQQIRIVLRAKGQEDLKISVKPVNTD